MITMRDMQRHIDNLSDDGDDEAPICPCCENSMSEFKGQWECEDCDC